jgi:hypothetical protein
MSNQDKASQQDAYELPDEVDFTKAIRGKFYRQVVSFETQITGPFIEFKDYQQFLNKRVKVIVMVEEA